MKAETLFMFSLILACLASNHVNSRSIHDLNEEKRNLGDIFRFQPRYDEFESDDFEGPDEKRFEDWSNDSGGDSNRQSCSGLHGSWFC